MKKLLLTLSAFLSFVAAPLHAQPFSYDFVELLYMRTHYDESGITDSNGLQANISVAPIESFVFEGSYERERTKLYGTATYDLDTFKYGVAGILPLERDLHLVGRVGGLHLDASGDLGNLSDDGIYLGGSLRTMLSRELELEPLIQWESINSQSTWTFGVNALVKLDQNFALDGGVLINDESDVRLLAGGRFSWQ